MLQETLEGINPKARKIAYFVFAVIIVALGSFDVGYAEAGIDAPTWVAVATKVIMYIGGAFGIVAASNTPTSKLVEPAQDDTDDDLDFDAVDAELEELNADLESDESGAHAGQ